MENEIIILIVESMAVYFLVLWAHSLRHRFGLVYFFALIGGMTAIMSWVTDAGVNIQVCGITFVIGSSVFYTSLLLGVFVVYVFDGPQAARTAISTIVGVSAMVPLIAASLHLQMDLMDNASMAYVPLPSLRINVASVAATLIDLFFLAMAWEYLGKPNLNFKLWLRAFLTLLGVMWLDVILFTTIAFAGTPDYLSIMKGTLISRFIISLFALPFLYFYIGWQRKKIGNEIENRPVLAILKMVAEIELDLSHAQEEIRRMKKAEKMTQNKMAELLQANKEVKRLSIEDPLTGLYNRRHFQAMAHKELQRSVRYNLPLSTIMMDIDRFKQVNDTYGHAIGDGVLRDIARLCIKTFRASDWVGRYGGEEFAFILAETQSTGAKNLAERLRTAISELGFQKDGRRFTVTASFGVYTRQGDEESIDTFLERSDQALYDAKSRGRNCVVVWHPIGEDHPKDSPKTSLKMMDEAKGSYE